MHDRDSPDAISSALESVLARFATLVRGAGRKHGLTEHELDEHMQAVRLRLWKARETSEQIGATPTSYIYRTAVTAALDLIRARREHREEPIETLTESVEERLGSTPGPDVRLESHETAQLVGAAVQEITPSRRPVVRMYLTGYDRDEIARLLGWSEAKTRNLLYRGLAELRELLSKRGITASPGELQ